MNNFSFKNVNLTVIGGWLQNISEIANSKEQTLLGTHNFHHPQTSYNFFLFSLILFGWRVKKILGKFEYIAENWALNIRRAGIFEWRREKMKTVFELYGMCVCELGSKFIFILSYYIFKSESVCAFYCRVNSICIRSAEWSLRMSIGFTITSDFFWVLIR